MTERTTGESVAGGVQSGLEMIREHTFLQILMKKSYMTESDAKKLYADLTKAERCRLNAVTCLKMLNLLDAHVSFFRRFTTKIQ